MGLVDPRTILPGVISSLAYFDEILVPNPFPHPRLISPEYSPTESPQLHKSQMLKNVLVLLTLQPFIDAGIVHLVPDPKEFDPDFRRQIVAMAEDRTTGWTLSAEEAKPGMALGEDESRRAIARLPPDQLEQFIRQTDPHIDQSLLQAVVAHIRASLDDDPLALLQSVEGGPEGGQLQMLRSINLELALFLAQLTGAALYTDQPGNWRQLHQHTSAATDPRPQRWAPLATRMASLTFPVELDDSITAEIRASGSLCRMRRFFRRCRNAALVSRSRALDEQAAIELAAALERVARRSALEWRRCPAKDDRSVQLQRRFELSAPSGGFAMNTVHRLLTTSGRSNRLPSVPMAFLLSTVGGPTGALTP